MEDQLPQVTPSKEKQHLQQLQTSPTEIQTNGSGVTEPTTTPAPQPTTTSAPQPNTTTPFPSTQGDDSDDTSFTGDIYQLTFRNIVFLDDEEDQQGEENKPPPPKTPTYSPKPAEQTPCQPPTPVTDVPTPSTSKPMSPPQPSPTPTSPTSVPSVTDEPTP